MIRSSVDFPAPFGPSTPIFAPWRNDSEMFDEHLTIGAVELVGPVHRVDEVRRHAPRLDEVGSGRCPGGRKSWLLREALERPGDIAQKLDVTPVGEQLAASAGLSQSASSTSLSKVSSPATTLINQ